MASVDERALEVARRQRGLISRRQLAAAGVSPATVGRRIRRGRWCEPLPGVVDLTTHEGSWRKSLQQLLLATAPDSWASHRSAAHLQRFLDVAEPATLDVLVRRGRHSTIGGLHLHTTRALGDDETTTVAGLRCTAAARTLLDLAPTVTIAELERFTADLARRDTAAFRHLGNLLDRYPRAPARRRLLDVLATLPEDVARLGSPLEVIGVPVLLRHGAPPPVLQYRVRDADGAVIKRVDAAWPTLWTVVEFDGRAWHDTPTAREHDAEVRARMRALGWTVEVLRFDDLDGPEPARIAADLRRRAAARS